MGARRLLAAAALACASFASAAADKLEVIVFPGGFNWPIWAAEAQGYFAAEGLEVKVTPTPSSMFQMENLLAGKFDIAFSTVDNVVAYDEGEGEVPLPSPPDFFVFMGGQFGAARLVVNPDIHSIPELKGKSLAVDAATTGYAFVLRKILQKGGLGENDYTFERVGSTAQRAQALMENKTAGTILTSPLEVLPESKGYRRLANAVDVIGPYQAVSGVARRSWAKAHSRELEGFIRAYVKGLDWLSDPNNKPDAIALYRKNIPQANEVAASKAWDALVPGPEGFQKKAKLDMEGVETVLQLRSEFGRPKAPLTDPAKYVDESYYERALKGR